MAKGKKIESLKKELLTFKESLGESGLAPDSPIMKTFFNYQLYKHSKRLEGFTIGLYALTLVLAILAIMNIVLLLRSYS